MSKTMTRKHVAMVDRLMDRYGVSPKEAHEALEEADWNVWEAGLIITTRAIRAADQTIMMQDIREATRLPFPLTSR